MVYELPPQRPESARRTHRGLDNYIIHSKQRGTKQAVRGMEAPEELRGLARDGLRRIAVRGLKARGPRMDAVFYLLDAMRLFREKSLQESF